MAFDHISAAEYASCSAAPQRLLERGREDGQTLIRVSARRCQALAGRIDFFRRAKRRILLLTGSLYPNVFPVTPPFPYLFS